MINYVRNALDNQLKECNEQTFFSIIRSANVADIVAAVRTGDKARKRALPAFTLQGVLDETKRAQIAAETANRGGRSVPTRQARWMRPNGFAMVDIDRKYGSAQALWELYTASMEMHEVDWREVTIMAHRTPGGHGLRLLLPVPHGRTIVEVQAKVAEVMGVEIDQACKDISRLSFAVPEADFFYINRPWLFATLPDPDDDEPCGLEPLFGTVAPSPATPRGGADSPARVSALPHGGAGRGAVCFPLTYQGVPYTEIVRELVAQCGGAPEHGYRNKYIYDRARELAYICDRDPEWVASVLPTFGEDEEKAKATIQSACVNVQPRGRFPEVLERAIEEARQLTLSQGRAEADATPCPVLPERLPAVLEHLTSNVDARYKPAVAMAVMPALGAHLGNVRFRYIDNKAHEAVGMVVCMAPQSSGKGSVCEPIRYICSDLEAEDILNQQKDNKWREECRSLGANKQKPDRPEVWTNLPSPNTTPAAMLQMAMDAKGRRMFTMMNELDMLSDLRLTPSKRDPSIPIRLAFDTDKIQANRVGANSVNGGAQFRWNFYASTTPELGVKFFTPYLFNGALSRITMCTIETELGDDLPVFGIYNDKFAHTLEPYIKRLTELRDKSLADYPADGTVVRCAEAEQLAADIEQEYKDKIIASGDQQFAELAYRAELTGYLRGMVLYCAEGAWSKEIEDYVRWSVAYDLYVKMRYFADSLEKNKDTVVLTSGRPNSILSLLPKDFTLDNLSALPSKFKSKNKKELLKKWRLRGLIEVDENDVYHKTEKALKQ